MRNSGPDSTHASDDIRMDISARQEKKKILREQNINSRFYSIAETFQFLAAAMLPVALGLVIAASKDLLAAAATEAGVAVTALGTSATFAAVGAAFASAPVLIFLGAAAFCTAVAIGSRYAASKHYHNANFNSTELNAQHTAKYMVKELKSQASCIAPEIPENARADGKQWAQVVSEQSTVQLARN